MMTGDNAFQGSHMASGRKWAFGNVSLLLFLLAYSCNDDNDHTVTVMAFIPRLLRALAYYPSQVNGPFLPLVVVITYLLCVQWYTMSFCFPLCNTCYDTEYGDKLKKNFLNK